MRSTEGSVEMDMRLLAARALQCCTSPVESERITAAERSVREVLADVRSLHRNVGGICAQCHVHGVPGAPWPCATFRALREPSC